MKVWELKMKLILRSMTKLMLGGQMDDDADFVPIGEDSYSSQVVNQERGNNLLILTCSLYYGLLFWVCDFSKWKGSVQDYSLPWARPTKDLLSTTWSHSYRQSSSGLSTMWSALQKYIEFKNVFVSLLGLWC